MAVAIAKGWAFCGFAMKRVRSRNPIPTSKHWIDEPLSRRRAKQTLLRLSYHIARHRPKACYTCTTRSAKLSAAVGWSLVCLFGRGERTSGAGDHRSRPDRARRIRSSGRRSSSWRGRVLETCERRAPVSARVLAYYVCTYSGDQKAAVVACTKLRSALQDAPTYESHTIRQNDFI